MGEAAVMKARFQVALSFPGEYRARVERIAVKLAERPGGGLDRFAAHAEYFGRLIRQDWDNAIPYTPAAKAQE